MILNDSLETKPSERANSVALLNAVIGGQNAERKRIARDLHDSIGCLLSTTRLLYDTIEPKNQKRYEEVKALLSETQIELRRIVNNLMPAALENLGLIAALQQLCELINLGGKVKIQFKAVDLEKTSLSNDLKINLYRIVQELFNNFIKHSCATKMELLLKYNNNSIYIFLKSNGNQLSKSDFQSLSIQNRVQGLRGKMELKHRLDYSIIQVRVPVLKP